MFSFVRRDIPSANGYNVVLCSSSFPDVLIFCFTSWEFDSMPISDMIDNVLWYYVNFGFDDCILEHDGPYLSIVPKDAFL